jgi:TonB family protein
LQGTVRVKLQVTPRGKITDAQIERGLGLGLDQQALKAVKQWVYADVSQTLREDELITLSVPFLLDPPGTWKVTGSVFQLTDPGREGKSDGPSSRSTPAPKMDYASNGNGMSRSAWTWVRTGPLSQFPQPAQVTSQRNRQQ